LLFANASMVQNVTVGGQLLTGTNRLTLPNPVLKDFKMHVEGT
jgi:hypothetical protein